MPLSPRYPCRVCGVVGCTTAHPPRRRRGRWLQAERYALFARQPFCVLCLAKGIRTVATVRDHIIALVHGGPDDATNTQALCAECNQAKSTRNNDELLRDTPLSHRPDPGATR